MGLSVFNREIEHIYYARYCQILALMNPDKSREEITGLLFETDWFSLVRTSVQVTLTSCTHSLSTGSCSMSHTYSSLKYNFQKLNP